MARSKQFQKNRARSARDERRDPEKVPEAQAEAEAEEPDYGWWPWVGPAVSARPRRVSRKSGAAGSCARAVGGRCGARWPLTRYAFEQRAVVTGRARTLSPRRWPRGDKPLVWVARETPGRLVFGRARGGSGGIVGLVASGAIMAKWPLPAALWTGR